MLIPIRKAALGVMAFAFGVGLGAADFLYQKIQAGGAFTQAQYTELLIDRFDGSGGTLGLVFRKSAAVNAALPPAPEGWQAETWSSVSYDGLFSPAQKAARDRHLVQAVPDVSYLADMADAEERLLDVYLDDVSRVYLAGQGGDAGYVDLSVSVPGRMIGSPAWQRYIDEIDGYYDRMNSRQPYATIAGVSWTERRGPVEMASSQQLPHDLHRLEATLGPVSLQLVARAPDAALRGFLAALDLSGLRAMAAHAPARPQPYPPARPAWDWRYPPEPGPDRRLDLLAQLAN